jgi:hypothetical protein
LETARIHSESNQGTRMDVPFQKSIFGPETDCLTAPFELEYCYGGESSRDAVWCCGRIPAFQRTLLLTFHPEDGVRKALRNVEVFWVVTHCGRIPTFRRTMLPPSSGLTLHGVTTPKTSTHCE